MLWGPASFWAEPHRETSEFGALLGIFSTQSPALFTVLYLPLMAVTVAVILGWRTRPMILLLVLGMAGLVERADTLGDQGDNIARIGLTLMLLMNVTAHWSLDARRRRRAQSRGELSLWQKLWHGLPVLPRWITDPLLHPVTRRLALLGIIVFHGGIAVLMGLPWFSLAMLAFDAIFVSSLTWRRLQLLVRRSRAHRRRRRRSSAAAAE